MGLKAEAPGQAGSPTKSSRTSGLAQLEELPAQLPCVEGPGIVYPQGGLDLWRKMLTPASANRRARFFWEGCACARRLNQAPWRSEGYLQDGWVQELKEVPPHRGIEPVTLKDTKSP